MKPVFSKPEDGLFWITGASSGIGYAVALEAARRGWRVVATARRPDELAALASAADGLPGRIIPAPADVTDAAALADLVRQVEAEHGPITRAFLNAGIYLPVRLFPFEAGKMHRSFAVNVGGAINALDALVPHMVPRGRGQIVFNASVAGYSGLPTSAGYGATKAALINMAESLRLDGDLSGILIQVVNPGFIRTPATDTNPFPMPFLMDVEPAAIRVLDGMDSTAFEITFPRRFTFFLKFLRMLPRRWYLPLVSWSTGWNDKGKVN
ncbi:MAG: SDR family NAD(P)-dependent oxidoreductase [Beijerinckiaceae bacterium]|nr:SDR family NAD(P)-dependent oxidoreductase [Beijerinckiaceae bacterium]